MKPGKKGKNANMKGGMMGGMGRMGGMMGGMGGMGRMGGMMGGMGGMGRMGGMVGMMGGMGGMMGGMGMGMPGMGMGMPGMGMGMGNQGKNQGNQGNQKNGGNNKASNSNNNRNNSNTNLDNLNDADSGAPGALLESNILSYKNIILVLIVILVLFIIGYFVSFSYRESKGIFELTNGKEYVFIDSRVNTRAHRDKKLCDFYVASAYRPYLVINQRFDYCSLQMLKSVLLLGVRSVYIDVFNSTLNENAYPIVTTGIKKGEWKLGLNSLNFEDVCVVIASTVFSNGFVNNFRDPFILCLNLNTNGNVKCLNRIKKTLYKIFRSNLLSNDYTFGSKNMAEVKVKDLLGKVIICTSDGYQNSELEELVNFSWDREELNHISYKSIDPSIPDTDVVKYRTDSLKDYNKNNMTIVVPEESSWGTYNYDLQYAEAAGCQLIFMNYNKMGDHLDKYITRFKNDSFLPKPLNMITLSGTETQNMEKMVKESIDEEDESVRLQCPIDGAENPLDQSMP